MRPISTLLVLAATAAAALAADDAPGWFRDAATATHATYPAKTPAVVLLDDERVAVDGNGRQVTTQREVVKVLTQEGRAHARARVSFIADAAKVREFHAWVIFPSGRVKEYSKKDIVEAALADVELYSPYRMRMIDGSGDCDPGAVFGYEVVLEEKTVFSQFTHYFQGTTPVRMSRFTLEVPAGWRAEAQAFGGAKADPESGGAISTWTMRELPPIDREPDAPRLRSMLPWVAVSLMPEGGGTGGGAMVCFRNWQDVSRWKAGLAEPQAAVTAAIEKTAADLTAGKTAPLDQIRALAEYTQKIRYVAIATNLARGGGYVPHPADEVLRKAYGDCKDKANLLRALLKAKGISSWMISIYSGDPDATRAEWPSPHQFNHAILAIQVPAETKLPASFAHPKFGRLLLFDPTDPHVPFGYLPDHEQKSHALLLAPEEGGLVETPSSKAAENHVERAVMVAMNGEGGIEVSALEKRIGQSGFDSSARFRELAPDVHHKRMERWVAANVPGATLSKLEVRDRQKDDAFELTVGFAAPVYARSMRGKLLMLRPAVLAMPGVPDISREKRTMALEIEPVSFHESVVVSLPEGFAIDEMPDAVDVKQPFGSFSAKWTAKDGKLTFERSLAVERTLVATGDYATAREFFLRVGGAESAPVVLVKK